MALNTSRRGFFGLAVAGLAGALTRVFGANADVGQPNAGRRRTTERRLTAITDPLARTQTYVYDAEGLRVSGPVYSYVRDFDDSRYTKFEYREWEADS